MSCKKIQICNVCEAPFEMERGCGLEKRCHACRILKEQKSPSSNSIFNLIHVPREVLKASLLTKSKSCDELDMSKCKFNMLHSMNYYEVIDYHGEEHTCKDEPAEDSLLNDELKKIIDIALNSLTGREMLVVKMVNGYTEDKVEKTYKEIGKYLSLSTERIRQLESSGIRKLRHPLIGGDLKRYIEQ